MKHVLRNGLMALGLVIGSVTSATAQVSVGVWLPGVSIGINLPVYPHLVAVPGYPVYYAPQMNSNYFFYDGMYWVFRGTAGTRAPGTTAPGRSFPLGTCPCSSSASR